jgi:hypothetical protein
VISGTAFTIEDPYMVEAACRGLVPTIASASEIRDIQSQCESERAICLACEDGMVVIDLRPDATGFGLELFVWLAVAFKHGAFARQDTELDKIGRELGARTLAFQSRRRGWARRLGPEWERRGKDEFVRMIR